MKRSSILVTIALLSACTGSADDTTTSTTATTIATTTTTTVDPRAVAEQTCDAMKVAAFDLDATVTDGIETLGLQSETDLADAEVGRVVVQGLVSFYDALAEIAVEAPEGIGPALETVSAAADPWRQALELDNTALETALEDLDPASLRTSEVDEAITTLDAWSADACGAVIPLDAEEIMFTTVFAAMFGAMGSLFEGFGDELFGSDDIPADITAVAYGDDPALDDLYEDCGTGDGQACRDLYFSAYGEYELWGQTCGASIPLRAAFLVDCGAKFASTAQDYGEDFLLDTLWDECAAGDLESCDGLFASAGFGTRYEEFGATCGDARIVVDTAAPCSFTAGDEPFGYGEDPELDALWDACSVGDAIACDDLFFQTPIGSAYEAFGRVCGDLAEMGRSCENVAAWLGGPVG